MSDDLPFQTQDRQAIRLTLLAFTAFATISCSDTPQWSPSADSDLVVPELVSSLNAEHEFAPPPVEAAPFPQLGYSGALRFSNAYIRTFGPTSSSLWSRQAGTAVDWRELRRCIGPIFATSAYELDAMMPAYLRNHLAGRFITQYCDRTGVARVLVSIAASATMLQVVAGERLIIPADGANAVLAGGLPAEYGGKPAILSMNSAMALAVGASGRRVSAVPELQLSTLPEGPMFARWRIVLEGAGESASVNGSENVVFVGSKLGILTGPTVLVRSTSAQLQADVLPGTPTREIYENTRAVKLTRRSQRSGSSDLTPLSRSSAR